MIKQTTETLIPADLKTVWETVTDLRHTRWRSDLEKTVVLNRAQFLEVDKDGIRTFFTITRTDPGSLWEFRLENDNLIGTWRGSFRPEGEFTRLQLTEELEPKNWWMRFPMRLYVRKMQKRYIEDLVKETDRKRRRKKDFPY